MKKTVIGIDIDARRVILTALAYENGAVMEVTGSYKPLILEDDNIAENVCRFRDALFATFDSLNCAAISIRSRNPNGKGQHAPSPISFKVEGIIQTYKECKVRLTPPQTVAAFIKKNPLPLSASYRYQDEALKVAYHCLLQEWS